MDVIGLVKSLESDRQIYQVANNARLQFGTRQAPFLFSALMPERLVMDRIISDEQMSLKSVSALDAPRNSPVTPRGQAKGGSNLFELADSNIGSEFTGRAYEGFLGYLASAEVNGVPGMEVAANQLLQWEESQIARPLAILRERYRCQAVVDARIVRKGDGGFYEVVDYPNPEGHRITVPSGTFDSPAGLYDREYDIWEDIVSRRDSLLTTEGLTVSTLITTQKMVSQFSRHPITQSYGGAAPGGGNMQPNAFQGALAYFNLPSTMGENLWLYDSMYDVESTDKRTSRARFIPDNVVIMLCNTNREETIQLGDDVDPAVFYDTLGYTAIGPVSGEAQPFVKVQMFPQQRHPAGIIYEGVQCAFPILQEPDAIVVIRYPDLTEA